MERKVIVSAVRALNATGLVGAVDTKLKDAELTSAFVKAVELVQKKKLEGKLPDEVGEAYNTLFDELGFQEAGGGVVEKPSKETAKKEPPKKETAQKEPPKKETTQKEVVKKSSGKLISAESINELTFDNCPDNYQELKDQSKKLDVTSQVSTLLLGQRLLKIRDGELYKEDGYSDFKAFVAGELAVGRTTAYNAIDIVNYFGVQLTEHGVSPNALIPSLPLLKAPDDIISKSEKKEIKSQVLKEAKTKTEKQMRELVKGIKVKFGMQPAPKDEPTDKLESAFLKFFNAVPDELTASDRKKIQKYIKKLEDLLK